MKRKNRGFVLVFTIIALALSMGIFFRYSMNTRAKKLKIIEKRKLFDIEESVKKSISAGINETYLMDQMIVNRRDFNFDGTKTSSETNPGIGVKKTVSNVYRNSDYFIVKDKYYEENSGVFPVGEKIWQAGVSSAYNIENFWVRVVKKNEDGKVSQTDPNYYVGGTNSFTTEKFDKEVRFSKGGYYLKSVQIEVGNVIPPKYENKFIYFAEYSEFNNDSKKTHYLKDDGTGIVINEYSDGNVDPIAMADPIKTYLNMPGVTGEVKFLVRVKKDIAYQVTSTNKIVAAFEGIADLRVTYNNVSVNKDTSNPDKIEVINYEMNHLGP